MNFKLFFKEKIVTILLLLFGLITIEIFLMAYNVGMFIKIYIPFIIMGLYITSIIIEYFKKKNILAIEVDSNQGKGIKQVTQAIEKIMEEELKLQNSKGRIRKTIRVMIVGIPNVGKSSFINRISKKTTMTVGNKPGVTRQKQWIRIGNQIELLDTPGVLWPKFESQEVALNLSYIGTIKDENLEITEIVYNLLKVLRESYMTNLSNRYKFTLEEYENQCSVTEDKIIALLRALHLALFFEFILSNADFNFKKVWISILLKSKEDTSSSELLELLPFLLSELILFKISFKLSGTPFFSIILENSDIKLDISSITTSINYYYF